jgi:hypothetical protein
MTPPPPPSPEILGVGILDEPVTLAETSVRDISGALVLTMCTRGDRGHPIIGEPANHVRLSS